MLSTKAFKILAAITNLGYRLYLFPFRFDQHSKDPSGFRCVQALMHKRWLLILNNILSCLLECAVALILLIPIFLGSLSIENAVMSFGVALPLLHCTANQIYWILHPKVGPALINRIIKYNQTQSKTTF